MELDSANLPLLGVCLSVLGLSVEGGLHKGRPTVGSDLQSRWQGLRC